MEARNDVAYTWWLVCGVLTKLVLTIITFGIKVPSGVIIPALDGGALFGRLIGQCIPDISPGIFAMVGAAAFLAGVTSVVKSRARDGTSRRNGLRKSRVQTVYETNSCTLTRPNQRAPSFGAYSRNCC